MRIDVAVLTAKPEEYAAVRDRLQNLASWPGSRSHPNQYAWVVGQIPSTRASGSYRVAVGITLDQTNIVSAVAAMSAYSTFEPRYLAFVGIAGGIDTELRKGDVLVADYVRAYEYGSVNDVDGFVPRNKYQEATDQALRAAAAAFNAGSEWPTQAGTKPDGSGSPRLFFGGLASGEKVVETTTADGFAPVLASDPRLRAVEMEGAGLAIAVQHLKQTGKAIGLLIVRGISDTPSSSTTASTNRVTRHEWTGFASRAAATFLVNFIADAFPYPPDQDNGRDATLPGEANRQQLGTNVFAGYTSHFVTSSELPEIHAINDGAFQSSVLLPRPHLESWWRANPFCMRRVMTVTGRSVGYWNVVPVVPEAFHGLVDGRFAERDVTDRHIPSYDSVERGALYVYIGAVVASELSASAAVVLDLVAFLEILDSVMGLDGLCAQSVQDDPIPTLRNFGWRESSKRGNTITWVLESRPEINRAFEAAHRHLRDLRGLRPQPLRQEESRLRQLLKR